MSQVLPIWSVSIYSYDYEENVFDQNCNFIGVYT